MKNDQEFTIKERKRKKMFGKKICCIKKNIVNIFMLIFKNKNSFCLYVWLQNDVSDIQVNRRNANSKIHTNNTYEISVF